jgi:hypothetical protein
VGALLAFVGIYIIQHAQGDQTSEYVFSGAMALIGAAGMLLTALLFPLTRPRSR